MTFQKLLEMLSYSIHLGVHMSYVPVIFLRKAILLGLFQIYHQSYSDKYYQNISTHKIQLANRNKACRAPTGFCR